MIFTEPTEYEKEICLATLKQMTGTEWHYVFYCQQDPIYVAVCRDYYEYTSMFHGERKCALWGFTRLYQHSDEVHIAHDKVLAEALRRGVKVATKLGII